MGWKATRQAYQGRPAKSSPKTAAVEDGLVRSGDGYVLEVAGIAGDLPF
jgi:hypothetical protein